MAELDDLNEGADNLRGSIGDLKDVLNELAISLNKSANVVVPDFIVPTIKKDNFTIK